MRAFAATARSLGFELSTFEIQRPEDIAPAFETLKGYVEALYVTADPLLNTYRIRIVTLANVARLPTSRVRGACCRRSASTFASRTCVCPTVMDSTWWP